MARYVNLLMIMKSSHDYLSCQAHRSEGIKKDSLYKLPLFIEPNQRRQEPEAEPDRKEDHHQNPFY